MAYVRFSEDSDVYVYHDGDGYVCCGCRFEEKSWTYDTADEIVEHLHEHELAGHMVPERAYIALEPEQRIEAFPEGGTYSLAQLNDLVRGLRANRARFDLMLRYVHAMVEAMKRTKK